MAHPRRQKKPLKESREANHHGAEPAAQTNGKSDPVSAFVAPALRLLNTMTSLINFTLSHETINAEDLKSQKEAREHFKGLVMAFLEFMASARDEKLSRELTDPVCWANIHASHAVEWVGKYAGLLVERILGCAEGKRIKTLVEIFNDPHLGQTLNGAITGLRSYDYEMVAYRLLAERNWALRYREPDKEANKRGAPARNKARNAWIVNQRKKRKTYQAILGELQDRCKEKNWESVSSPQAIYAICTKSKLDLTTRTIRATSNFKSNRPAI
jgi:hypothetical protein